MIILFLLVVNLMPTPFINNFFSAPHYYRCNSVLVEIRCCTPIVKCIRCHRYYTLAQYRYSYEHHCAIHAEANLVHAQADLYSSRDSHVSFFVLLTLDLMFFLGHLFFLLSLKCIQCHHSYTFTCFGFCIPCRRTYYLNYKWFKLTI